MWTKADDLAEAHDKIRYWKERAEEAESVIGARINPFMSSDDRLIGAVYEVADGYTVVAVNGNTGRSYTKVCQTFLEVLHFLIDEGLSFDAEYKEIRKYLHERLRGDE